MNKLFIALCALSFSTATTQIFADTTHDLKEAISDAQSADIIKSFLKIGPNGTEATNPTYKGFFILTPEGYLNTVDVTEVKFKVKAKIGIIPLISNETLSLAGVLPTLDCNTPEITRATLTGTNPLLDNEVRKYFVEHASEIFKNNFIAQTDLIKYCKIKPEPKSTTEVNTQPLFDFELILE